MFKNPYTEFHGKSLILADYLSIDRTLLANERTLLAYFRTSLTLLVAGASFIQFFEIVIIQIVGWIFIPFSLIIGVIGIIRYRRINSPILDLKFMRSDISVNQ